MGKKVYDKNSLQRQLSVYKARREKLKAEHGRTPLYAKKVKKINSAIGNLTVSIRKVDAIEDRMRVVNERVKEFTGVSVWKVGKTGKPEVKQAKNLFYRECSEMGIAGGYQAIFCGINRKISPTQQRMAFIRSFKTKPENRDLWRRWKVFLSEFQNND